MLVLGLLCLSGIAQTATGSPETTLIDDIEPHDGTIGADSPLYGLKLALEDMDLSFTADETERIDKQLDHARLRLSEVSRSLDLNQSESAAKALNNYWLKTDLTNSSIASWHSGATGLLPAEEMNIMQQVVLENLLTRYPDDTGIRRAYNSSLALEEKFAEKTGIKYQRTIDQNNRIILTAIRL